MKKLNKSLLVAMVVMLVLAMTIGCTAKENTSSETESATVSTVQTTEAQTTESSDQAETSAETIDYSQYTIGFSQDWNYIAWTQMMKDDIIATCEQYGVNYTCTDAENSGEKQISDIEDLITLGVDVILVSTYHADAIANAVQDAMDVGIPVIVLSSEIPGVTPTCHISADSIATGETCGNKVVEKFPNGANIIQLTGKEGSVVNQMRGQGFRNIIDNTPGFNVLAEVSCNYSRSEALTAMEDLIGVYGDQIQVVYTHNDDMALGAIEALEEAGMTPNVENGIFVISAADAIYDEVYDAVEAGKMISYFYPTFGVEGVETALAILRGEAVEPKIIVTAPICDKSTVADFRK